MFTIEELTEMLSLAEKEKQWILTTTAYYSENPDVVNKVLQSNYKERLELLDNIINKLKQLEISIIVR